MISSWLFATAFVTVCQVVADDTTLLQLLARQAPGTPSYNCHDNCGTAITQSKQSNACTNSAFVQNYNNCLQCAGPDNQNIWRLYGTTLTAAGAACGFKTEPLAGKQPDVGPASAPTSSSTVASASAVIATSSRSGSSSVTQVSVSATSSVVAETSVRSPTSQNTTSMARMTSSLFTPSPQTSNPAAPLSSSDALMAVGIAGLWFLTH